MITLKDLVTEQQISGRTDIEVIQNFFRLKFQYIPCYSLSMMWKKWKLWIN